MNTDTYFGMILNILVGLTFIAIVLAFLYLVYGEKEESRSTSKAEVAKNTYAHFSSLFFRFQAFLSGTNS